MYEHNDTLKPKVAVCILILILGIAAAFRFIGLDWDGHAHLHPDERFLTMVTTGISWPKDLQQYFDTNVSPLNPQNNGFSFYVYGTYPIHLTKFVAMVLHNDTYDGVTLVGRALSGILDLATLITVYLIASYLTKKRITGLIAAACYAVFVLPIQLSHFFTVDPYVTLFITVVLWRILRSKFDFITGVMLAFAVGAKASAVIIVPIIALAYALEWPWAGHTTAVRQKRRHMLLMACGCLIGFLLTVRIVYPYLFVGMTLNPKILANWRELSSFDSPNTTFPPGLQWITVTPIQPILDLLVWGLGIPLGLLTVIAIGAGMVRAAKHVAKHTLMVILLVWIIFALIYQAVQFAKPMRYFWPIYPSLAVMTGWYLTERIKHWRPVIWTAFMVVLLIWPVAYLNIYMHTTTRVSANDWIYAHIPVGKTIAWESWDDPLPFPKNGFSPGVYHTPALPVFDPDSPEKWAKIEAALAQADYLILSSNRGYGAMGRVKDRYPETYRYYQLLINGSLGFRPVVQFVSRPALPIPGLAVCIRPPGFSYGFLADQLDTCKQTGITFVDDGTDETFTVYDHPKVIIFQKVGTVNYSELLGK